MEATAEGLQASTPAMKAARKHALLYLLSRIRQCKGFLPGSRIVKAVEFLAEFFNVDSNWYAQEEHAAAELLHIHDGPMCWCLQHGNDIAKSSGARWRLMIARHPPSFSEGRWTTASPNFAYFALWNMLGMMGGFCMRHAFQKAKLETVASDTNETQWKREASSRLLGCTEFMCNSRTIVSCCVGVLCNDALQRSLALVFKGEAKTYPDVKHLAQRMNMDDMEEEGQGTPGAASQARQRDVPLIIQLVLGAKVRSLLREGAALVWERQRPLPVHVAAFRACFCPGDVTQTGAKQIELNTCGLRTFQATHSYSIAWTSSWPRHVHTSC